MKPESEVNATMGGWPPDRIFEMQDAPNEDCFYEDGYCDCDNCAHYTQCVECGDYEGECGCEE